MTTLSHHTFSDRTVSLRSAVSARPASGFEQSLAQASLRRLKTAKSEAAAVLGVLNQYENAVAVQRRYSAYYSS